MPNKTLRYTICIVGFILMIPFSPCTKVRHSENKQGKTPQTIKKYRLYTAEFFVPISRDCLKSVWTSSASHFMQDHSLASWFIHLTPRKGEDCPHSTHSPWSWLNPAYKRPFPYGLLSSRFIFRLVLVHFSPRPNCPPPASKICLRKQPPNLQPGRGGRRWTVSNYFDWRRRRLIISYSFPFPPNGVCCTTKCCVLKSRLSRVFLFFWAPLRKECVIFTLASEF